MQQASSPLASRGLGFQGSRGRRGRAGAGGQRLQAAAAAEDRQVLRLRSERGQSPAAGEERAADADDADAFVAGGILVAGDLEVGNELAGVLCAERGEGGHEALLEWEVSYGFAVQGVSECCHGDSGED